MLEWYKPKYEELPLSPKVVLEVMRPETWSALLSSATYINGAPGAGKTVLAAAIVDHISRHRDTTVARHFFRDDYEETILEVFRDIVYQILPWLKAASNATVGIYKKETAYNASILSKDLMGIIWDISANQINFYIVFDGLDEFPQYMKRLKHLPQLVAKGVKVVFQVEDSYHRGTHDQCNALKCTRGTKEYRIIRQLTT
ncbi:hypothetical protein J3E71DRAFT_336506 [Bipolaris maydis]|nr:hypothetical protein J3E71DRAFT_336506 [Bipolaris maydis]